MAFKALGIYASAGLLAFTAMPAAASTVMPAKFDFTVGSNSGISDGNVREFTATSPDLGTFKVRVTGWSYNGFIIQNSKLQVWDGGLGVLSGDDNESHTHTIDNLERKDFIILQFDRRVELVKATFTTFNLDGRSYTDSDATIRFGNTPDPYTTSLASLDGDPLSALDALFGPPNSLNPYASNGGGGTSTRNINPNGYSGNIWLIGASFNNPDYKYDGFKLKSLSVIPEPATWAMMIVGFGAIGWAARRRTEKRVIAGRC